MGGRTGLWVASAVALVAAFAVARLHADVRAQASDIERLRAQIASAQVESSPAPGTTVIQVVTASAAPATSAPPKSALEATLDEVDTGGDAREGAQKVACETSFQGETRDATWASATQPKLLADLRERLSTRSSVRSLECRATTCRLEMSSADAATLDSDLREVLISRPAWLGPTFTTAVETLASGEVISVAYLVREGHTLPIAL